jgi:hypothetical protein
LKEDAYRIGAGRGGGAGGVLLVLGDAGGRDAAVRPIPLVFSSGISLGRVPMTLLFTSARS